MAWLGGSSNVVFTYWGNVRNKPSFKCSMTETSDASVNYSASSADSHAHAKYNILSSLCMDKPIQRDPGKWKALEDYVKSEADDISIYGLKSYPKATLIWNYISIIMGNNPWITMEDAVGILKKEYSRPRVVKIRNEHWDIEEQKMYYIDNDKFMEWELWIKSTDNKKE